MTTAAFRLLLLVSGALAALGCTKKPAAPAPEPAATAAAAMPAAAKRPVNLFIWGDYTSKELLEEFTRRTGFVVVESNYGSNEELLAKLQAGATGYDVAIPSDYMVSIMTKLDLLEPLDRAKIPNAGEVDPQFLGKAFDPENRYSLPYAWSITGIAVNRAQYTEPVTSWADLLQNPKAAGRVSVLDDAREALGAALKLEGQSLNTTDAATLAKARDLLAAAKPRVKAFNSSPLDAVVAGEVHVAHMYAQEALLAGRETGGKVDFVIPKEGATLAIDNMVILKSAPNKEGAHALVSFLLDPATHADFVKRVMGGPVVKATKALLPAELQSHPVLYPSAEVLGRCEMMQDLGDATALYDRYWSEIKAASH